mmetsp:Transcript_34195/g.38208  ORF Transcript_34195/g.38208 Transcript_34195/m.38208 type:complete len:215 (+) Transcript_34195:478-1122(+)
MTCRTRAGSKLARPGAAGGGGGCIGGGGTPYCGGCCCCGCGGGAIGGTCTDLARGSALRALGSARDGVAVDASGGIELVATALRGSVLEAIVEEVAKDEAVAAAAAARGSKALALGSAALEADTVANGTMGLDLTESAVCTISNLLMIKSIASGSCGCPARRRRASSGSRSAISFIFATISYISPLDILFKESATALVPALLLFVTFVDDVEDR